MFASLGVANTRLKRCCAQANTRCRSLLHASPLSLARLSAAGPDLGTIRARRREYAVVSGQVGAGLGDQRGEPRNKVFRLDKIAGSDFGQPKAGPKGGGQDARSNITCVVPSR